MHECGSLLGGIVGMYLSGGLMLTKASLNVHSICGEGTKTNYLQFLLGLSCHRGRVVLVPPLPLLHPFAI